MKIIWKEINTKKDRFEEAGFIPRKEYEDTLNAVADQRDHYKQLEAQGA